MKDVDKFAAANPALTWRGQYGVEAGKYQVTGEVLPDTADKKATASEPVGKSWVKWPTQAQLSKGIK